MGNEESGMGKFHIRMYAWYGGWSIRNADSENTEDAEQRG